MGFTRTKWKRIKCSSQNKPAENVMAKDIYCDIPWPNSKSKYRLVNQRFSSRHIGNYLPTQSIVS